MDGKPRQVIRYPAISFLSTSGLVAVLLACLAVNRAPANRAEQTQEMVGEMVKTSPWVPKLADCVELSVHTPNDWRLSIYPNGTFYLRHGSGNVPTVAGFGGDKQGPLDFAGIHRHLAVVIDKNSNSRERYAIAFHRRNVGSTSCVYTDDENFVVSLFDKAKAAYVARAGDASWEKLWEDNPRTLPKRELRPK